MISKKIAILVDTNIISACHEHACWRAVSGAFALETVNECVTEFQTGLMDRSAVEYVDEPTLRGEFRAVHTPTPLERATVALLGGNALHAGERDLWACALAKPETWLLCGPDRASMRFGCDQKLSQRLVSLGALLSQIRCTPARSLPHHFSQRWLEDVRRDFILGKLGSQKGGI